MKKEFICKIDTSNWMRSYENAFVRVMSPSGKSVDIYKKHLGKMEPVDANCVWFIVNSNMKEMLLTREQMDKVLRLSKIPYFA
jgi:hypothetical protein